MNDLTEADLTQLVATCDRNSVESIDAMLAELGQHYYAPSVYSFRNDLEFRKLELLGNNEFEIACAKCSGSGTIKEDRPCHPPSKNTYEVRVACPDCHRAGYIPSELGRKILALLAHNLQRTRVECPVCDGHGREPYCSGDCVNCDGKGSYVVQPIWSNARVT